MPSNSESASTPTASSGICSQAASRQKSLQWQPARAGIKNSPPLTAGPRAA